MVVRSGIQPEARYALLVPGTDLLDKVCLRIFLSQQVAVFFVLNDINKLIGVLLFCENPGVAFYVDHGEKIARLLVIGYIDVRLCFQERNGVVLRSVGIASFLFSEFEIVDRFDSEPHPHRRFFECGHFDVIQIGKPILWLLLQQLLSKLGKPRIDVVIIRFCRQKVLVLGKIERRDGIISGHPHDVIDITSGQIVDFNTVQILVDSQRNKECAAGQLTADSCGNLFCGILRGRLCFLNVFRFLFFSSEYV